MELIDKDIINDLPIHDSDFIAVRILQHENGETDLIVDICFYMGEYEELEEKWLKLVDSNGRASFFIKNCLSVKVSLFCDNTQRDLFDYIQIEELQNEKKECIVINFVSGSKIECTADLISLIQYDANGA
jgi:hypothetical protein